MVQPKTQRTDLFLVMNKAIPLFVDYRQLPESPLK